MWFFLSTVVACVTLYLLARQLLSASFRPSLDIAIALKPPSGPGGDVMAPTPPEDVLRFCAQESEQFAREQLLADAHVLYRDLRDWDAVLQALQRRLAGYPPQE